MTQTVGSFVPLQQRNAMQPNPAVTQYEWPGSTGALGPMPPPGHTVSWRDWPGSVSRMGARQPNFPWWHPMYVSGYQGYKFYNPGNPGEAEYAGAVMDEREYNEGIAVSKAVYVPHPKHRKSVRVDVTRVHPITQEVGEVDVGDGTLMLWDISRQRPHITNEQACPPGYRLYKGRCFRTAPAASGRQENPRHPVYLNTWSLPWSYPWAYTQNPRTLNWGYVHPRFGYRTPWSGWGGYYPVYPGRAYYDQRVVCERVDESESCPTGTVVERDREGNKICCPPERNIWQTAVWPTYYWWCPGCGHYPRHHHRHHRHHGALGGPRQTAFVGGSGRIGQSAGVSGGGGGTGVVGGGGMIGQSGGAVGRNPEESEVMEAIMEEGRMENPCNACNVRVPAGLVDMTGNPITREDVEDMIEEVIENPSHGGRMAVRMPWERSGTGAGKEPCGPGEVYDPVLNTCQPGKEPCGPGEVYDPVLGACQPGKPPQQPVGKVPLIAPPRPLHHTRTMAAMRGRL